ncbi:RNA-binding protein 7 [Leptopilina heterotoma]|uniref:RNA-binding protein 7 n=1 Tax=Leptopilina heterotoma TaxID=63436 RepID=UPI001CA7DAA1|nr:RNA-binding protein 7 [Leptopilina heterotoma]
MSEDERTIWLGNLNSEKVTEDVLYELFLQAGPLDRIHIPKDREGKQRNFAFVTYKHLVSVPYAVTLFDGTMLFNRQVYMKARSNEAQPNTNSAEQNHHYQNELIQLGNQMLQCIPNPSLVYGNFPSPPMLMQQPNQFIPQQFYYNEERRSQQNYAHPYQREPERNKGRYNNDPGHEKRRDNYSSSHRNNYRENPHYSQRHGGNRHENSSRESNNRQESSSRHDRRYYRS